MPDTTGYCRYSSGPCWYRISMAITVASTWSDCSSSLSQPPGLFSSRPPVLDHSTTGYATEYRRSAPANRRQSQGRGREAGERVGGRREGGGRPSVAGGRCSLPDSGWTRRGEERRGDEQRRAGDVYLCEIDAGCRASPDTAVLTCSKARDGISHARRRWLERPRWGCPDSCTVLTSPHMVPRLRHILCTGDIPRGALRVVSKVPRRRLSEPTTAPRCVFSDVPGVPSWCDVAREAPRPAQWEQLTGRYVIRPPSPPPPRPPLSLTPGPAHRQWLAMAALSDWRRVRPLAPIRLSG